MSWTMADCAIYEGDEVSGTQLFTISHNDLRDRAVFDSSGTEIPTGYRRKMMSMMPMAHIYWEVEGKTMIYATVKKVFQFRTAFGVFLHNPPMELEADDTMDWGNDRETPDFRVEVSTAGHLIILQGDVENNPVKIATVQKDNFDLMENFPLHITIGPQV